MIMDENRLKNTKADNKALTLKKLRRHSRSPGVRRIIKHNSDLHWLEAPMEKQRKLAERDNFSSRQRHNRSPLISATRCKKSLESLQEMTIGHREVRPSGERGDFFRRLSGCVLSDVAGDRVDGISNCGNDFQTCADVVYGKQIIHKNAGTAEQTPPSSPRHLSPRLINRSVATTCRTERDDSNDYCNGPLLKLMAESALSLQDGLNPTSLLRLNPMLKTTSLKMIYLKSMLGEQESPGPPTIYDTEKGYHINPTETCNMTSLNETKSPAYFGRSNDDLIMTDIVSTSPVYPTFGNPLIDQDEVAGDEIQGIRGCLFGDTLSLCCSVGSYVECDTRLFNAPHEQRMLHDRGRCECELCNDISSGINSLSYRSPTRVLNSSSPSTPSKFLSSLGHAHSIPIYEDFNMHPHEESSFVSAPPIDFFITRGCSPNPRRCSNEMYDY